MPENEKHAHDVFINCPFDEEYEPLFEAINFVIAACGYSPRCALEEDDGADIRLTKLCRIIEECPRSVHDLSKTQLNEAGLPRFNMPFELGLMMGAKYFGKKSFRKKSALIMVGEPFKMPAYLSDLGGNDPAAHKGHVTKVIELVRRYLHCRPEGAPLPRAEHIHEALKSFKVELPSMARERSIKPHELGAFKDYRTYAHFVAAFLGVNPLID